MNTRSMFAKAIIGATAGAMALGAVATAQAQPYGQYGYYGNGPDYSYDACKREKTNRSVMGGLIGAGLGAVLGSQVAASGHRTDGSVLGGVVGAGAGAMIGNRQAACENGQYTRVVPPPAPAAPPPVSYNDYDRGYYGARYDDDYAYSRRGERVRVADRPPSADNCTLAESPIYLPDGRVQKRFVRVCQDGGGRYQVVD